MRIIFYAIRIQQFKARKDTTKTNKTLLNKALKHIGASVMHHISQ